MALRIEAQRTQQVPGLLETLAGEGIEATDLHLDLAFVFGKQF